MPTLTDSDISQFDSQQQNVNLSDQDIAQFDNQTQPQSMSLQDKVMNVVGQFGKGVYNATPYLKRISQLMGNSISPANQEYDTLGEPKGTMEQIANMAGQTVPQIAMATPFMKAAGLLPILTKGLIEEGTSVLAPSVISVAKSVAQSSITQGSIGLAGYMGTKAGVQGQDVGQAVQEGLKQGIIFGAMTRLGATLMPTKIPLTKLNMPKPEVIGSVIGASVAGGMMEENPDKQLASSMFMGGLAALTPEERFNFNKSVANHVNWEKHFEETLQISPEMSKNIKQQGWDAIQYAGQLRKQVVVDGANQTWAVPQIAENNYQKGLSAKKEVDGVSGAKEQASQLFDKAITEMQDYKLPTSEISRVVKIVKAMANQSTDIGFKENINRELEKLMGVRPGVTKKLGGQITEDELSDYLIKSGLSQKATLVNIHNLKMAMGELVPAKMWDSPVDNNARIAKNIYNKLSTLIGNSNPAYQQATQEWGKMKRVEGDVMDLNASTLSKNWYDKSEPALQLEVENKLSRVEQYLTSKNLGQFNSKQLLKDYHTYNDFASAKLGRLGAIFPLRLAAGRGGAIIGGLLGLPFGVAGAGIGSSIGMLTAMKFARPEAYLPFLREIKAGSKTSGKVNSETAVSASHGLELLQQLLNH